ncbi:MAG: hypothetical protein O7149_00455 [Wolbachia endosymbiont of Hylaeus sinuatus]|nr:hypothetical protein [Wolbachia endosymbiont of Nomada flava]MDX5507086.1 hypothetical protein [Wolbachia endosymbiont of Hylaeus sinuatus]
MKNNKFVIPLLVSGIYAEIPRRYDVEKPFLGCIRSAKRCER